MTTAAGSFSFRQLEFILKGQMRDGMLAHRRLLVIPSTILMFLTWLCLGQSLRDDQAARAVTVSHSGGKWTISGKKNTVVLNESDLSTTVRSGSVTWKMVRSSNQDFWSAWTATSFVFAWPRLEQSGSSPRSRMVTDRWRSRCSRIS
jgi:hypothetical protein